MGVQDTLRTYIIKERFGGQAPAQFHDDYDLIDSGTIDSVFLVGLITYLEVHYKVEFGINDIVPRHFKSVRALADFVSNRASLQCAG